MTVILTLSDSDDWGGIVSETLTESIRDINGVSKVNGSCIISQPISSDDLLSMLSMRESMLLVYPSVESLISKELRNGASEDIAVAKGLQFAEELLVIHRGARKKLKMVNMCHLKVATEKERQSLSEYGWDIAGTFDLLPDDIFVVIAVQLIKQNKKLKKCTELLAASSLPLGQFTGIVDIGTILHNYHALVADKESLAIELSAQVDVERAKVEASINERNAISRMLSEKTDLVKHLRNCAVDKNLEIELLKLHLIALQGKLEKFLINDICSDESIKKLEEKNLIQTGQIALANSKIELLETHLSTVQEELKRYSINAKNAELKIKKQCCELASKAKQVIQLKVELENIKKSVSWKIGVPARFIGKALTPLNKKKQNVNQDISLLYNSALFDPVWYLKTYPDIADAGVDPAEHYLKFGAGEGRLPSAEFDGNWYLQRYPDVADSKVNPLIHYLRFGRREGRSSSPKSLWDSAEQVANNK